MDALLGAGVIHADELDLSTEGLLAVAKASVQATRRADALAGLLAPAPPRLQKISDKQKAPRQVGIGGQGASGT